MKWNPGVASTIGATVSEAARNVTRRWQNMSIYEKGGDDGERVVEKKEKGGGEATRGIHQGIYMFCREPCLMGSMIVHLGRWKARPSWATFLCVVSRARRRVVTTPTQL